LNPIPLQQNVETAKSGKESIRHFTNEEQASNQRTFSEPFVKNDDSTKEKGGPNMAEICLLVGGAALILSFLVVVFFTAFYINESGSTMLFVYILQIICGAASIILGLLALHLYKKGNIKSSDMWMAILGGILGFLGILFAFVQLHPNI
jgi:hypothetical protein